MDIATVYPLLKQAHVSLVVSSVALFAARGAAVLAGHPWAMHKPWRLLSYGIDTLLLGAGAGLWVLLSLHPVHHPWLGVKLLLLVVYIVLGSLALKRARTRELRAVSYGAALATYAFIASVAVAHSPLGLLDRTA